jgi:hypothetical protein
VPLDRLGGGPGEVDERDFNRRRPGIRWREPEDGAGAGERLVDNGRVAVRARYYLDTLADLSREG